MRETATVVLGGVAVSSPPLPACYCFPKDGAKSMELRVSLHLMLLYLHWGWSLLLTWGCPSQEQSTIAVCLAVCLATVVQDDVDTFWTSPASLPPAIVSAVDIRHPCSGRSGCSGYQTSLQWLQWLQWPQWPQWLQWPAQYNLTLVGFQCKI